MKVIAEIGCCHIGSLERAKKLAHLAKLSGADAVKTQKRNPKESVKKELWNEPHPNPSFAYGKTYLEHRENVELSIEDHIKLEEYCKEIDIEYSTSVWDMTSAKEVIENLHLNFIKIPSALNTNRELFDFLINDYNGDIHISTGMLSLEEKESLYKYWHKYNDRIVVYHCTSGYPVPFEQLYLKDIKKLSSIYNFKRIGYSNHGYGIATEPVAFALGARYFERHFIDDRTFAHTDAASSLEGQGLYKMVRDLKAIEKALQSKPDEIEEIERVQRDKLRI